VYSNFNKPSLLAHGISGRRGKVCVGGKDIPASDRLYENQLQSRQDFVPVQIFWQVFVR
jgi:hypothetical protein